MDKKYYQLEVGELEHAFETDLEKGLSESTVLEKQAKQGLNQLEEGKKRSFFLKFLDQLKDFMIVILLLAAVLALFTGETANGISRSKGRKSLRIN